MNVCDAAYAYSSGVKRSEFQISSHTSLGCVICFECFSPRLFHFLPFTGLAVASYEPHSAQMVPMVQEWVPGWAAEGWGQGPACS